MVLRGPKITGLRVSRDRGPPHVTWAFLRSGVSKIQNFRVQGMKVFSGFKVLKVKGIKGFWVPVDPKV